MMMMMMMTLTVQHDEYDCTIRVRRLCGLISNYFDHLLLLLLL